MEDAGASITGIGTVADQVWAAIVRVPLQLDGVPKGLEIGIKKYLTKDVNQRPKDDQPLHR